MEWIAKIWLAANFFFVYVWFNTDNRYVRNGGLGYIMTNDSPKISDVVESMETRFGGPERRNGNSDRRKRERRVADLNDRSTWTQDRAGDIEDKDGNAPH